MKKRLVHVSLLLSMFLVFFITTASATTDESIVMEGFEYLQDYHDYEEEEQVAEIITVYVSIDGGMRIAFQIESGLTVADLVQEVRAVSGQTYLFDELWHNPLYPNQVVELLTLVIEQYQEFAPVPYNTVTQYSDELPRGARVLLNYGQEGERGITHFVQFIGGVESFRNVIADEVVVEPVNAVIEIGVGDIPGMAVTASGQVFSYSQSLVMEATAYTADFYSTGRRPGDPGFGITASGLVAQVGVVAVDTSVIPFHTNLYIEGYGFAIAGDTGGAIRGNKIDLFFDTRTEALQFGRQYLRVWILE